MASPLGYLASYERSRPAFAARSAWGGMSLWERKQE